jgi:ANTAR domain
MKSKRSRTPESAGSHRRPRKGAERDRAVTLTDDGSEATPAPYQWADARADGPTWPAVPGERAPGPQRSDPPPERAEDDGFPHGRGAVARRTATGWRVGDEEVSDLTSAMVLADLLAAELPTETMPSLRGQPEPPRAPAAHDGELPDPKRLQETVAQLEHALRARVRVEQAIGVLAERHRLRPRQAFELLRSAARARGRRVMEIATEVVDSATNPLLRIPDELAKPPVTRRRGRVHRHTLENG